MSRRGTPLRAIINTIIGTGTALAVYLGIMVEDTVDETKKTVLESIETTSEVLTKMTQYTGLYSVYSFLAKIVELIAKVPELIVTIIKNAIVFFYIFCVLVFVGQFDWLLDDIYTLTAISLLLTYLTYR